MLEFGFECKCFGPETFRVQNEFYPSLSLFTPVHCISVGSSKWLRKTNYLKDDIGRNLGLESYLGKFFVVYKGSSNILQDCCRNCFSV